MFQLNPCHVFRIFESFSEYSKSFGNEAAPVGIKLYNSCINIYMIYIYMKIYEQYRKDMGIATDPQEDTV